jgi:hypothetical protein
VADPYNRRYVTAGDPYVAANGDSLGKRPYETQQMLVNQFGSDDAPIVFAEQINQSLLSLGQAVLTPQGVMMADNARFAVQKAGYNGPQDLPSIAQAYHLLATPPPPPPSPSSTPLQASATLGGLSLSGGVGGIPRPVLLVGGALLVYELFFRGRRRLL